MIETQILNKLVIAEAKQLKLNATKSELESLNFNTLNPSRTTSCIYGQMTGNCFSSRATELIELSCEKVYKCNYLNHPTELGGDLNGSPKEADRGSYWSPIELFISKRVNKDNDNNERLIAFLKGETVRLQLK